MAGATVFRESAIMCIILTMAGDTVAGSIRKHLGFVAGFTLDVVVFAEQRESGQVMSEVRRFFPTRFVVTVLTLFPLFALVYVIIEMTGNAGAIHLIGKRIFAMAVVAGQFTMTALKRELSISAVIKARIVPVDRAMAIAAFVSASTVMGIVCFVAGVTICRRAQIGGIFMAIQTIGLDMMTDQWIVGNIVIEFGVLPTGGVMAVHAGRTKAVLMHVIFLMTVNAGAGCITMFVGRLVAVNTKRVKVFTQQIKISKEVIEC